MIEFPVTIDCEIERLSRDNTRGISFDELQPRDSNLSRLANTLNISKDILQKKDNWYLYNGEYYYFKERYYITQILNELLGEYLSHYMSLPTVTYDLVLDDGIIVGLLSKNFCRADKKYIKAVDLNSFDLIRLKYALSIYSQNKELHEKLCRIIVKDYYSCMRDRKGNTLCEKDKFKLDVAPLYDYERSFKDDYFSAEYYNPLFRRLDLFGGYMKQINMSTIESLIEHDEYFARQIIKILEFDLARAFDNISDKNKINIPDAISYYYFKYDEKRKDELKRALKKVG